MEIEKFDNTENIAVQSVSKKKSKKRTKKSRSGAPNEATEHNGGEVCDGISNLKLESTYNEMALDLSEALNEKLHFNYNGGDISDVHSLTNGDNIKKKLVINNSVVSSNQIKKKHDKNDRVIENGCDKSLSIISSAHVSDTHENSPVEISKLELESPLPSSITKDTLPNSLALLQKVSSSLTSLPEIEYKEYESELQMPDIIRLIQKDLSEPYSIYTYRYFIHNWPKLCFLAMDNGKCVGAVVCKLDKHRNVNRGYIAMLAVDKDYRKLKIGTNLVQKAIQVRLIF